MTDELDDIAEELPVRGKCVYCENDAVATVEIRVRRRGGEKKQIRSKSASACAKHAKAVFLDIEKQMNKKRT